MIREPVSRIEPATEAAIAAFVTAHQRGLVRFLRAIGCPTSEAEEVAQDALLIALDRGMVARRDAGAFLRGAARRIWMRQRRDRARREQLLIRRAAETWEQDCAHDDGDGWHDAMTRCVGALPERSRRALEMRYVEEAPRERIAAELGIGEHGARTLLQRLRAALRECVQRRMRDEARR
ncbi:MAG: sigma factor-like helix-turn-helix DNA-binding protein [Planctomycetota bacterium]